MFVNRNQPVHVVFIVHFIMNESFADNGIKEYKLDHAGLCKTNEISLSFEPAGLLSDEARQVLLVEQSTKMGFSKVHRYKLQHGEWGYMYDLPLKGKVQIRSWTSLDSEQIALFDNGESSLSLFEYDYRPS